MLASAALSVAACFPEGKSKNNAAQASLTDAGKTNRSGKRDPLQETATGSEQLLSGSAKAPTGSIPNQRGQLIAATSTQTAQAELAPLNEKINDTPAPVALSRFFKTLGAFVKDKNGKQITILHFGDAHIAADRFSGDLREEFQARFGNAGRGMLMPGLYMARGVKFEQGGKWQTQLSTENQPGPYGITGAKVTAKDQDAWLRLTSTERFGWTEVTISSGRGTGSALIGVDGDIKPYSADDAIGWKTIRLNRQGQELFVKPSGDGPVTVYSFAVGTDQPGIRYVSFGLPGATAATPLLWDGPYLAADMKRLSPDLIVLSYGTEEALNDELDAADYEARVMATLARLRQIAPQASFMIIGPPDIARLPSFAAGLGRMSDVCRALGVAERQNYARWMRRHDARLAHWHSPLSLEPVRTVLRRVAAANQAFFWDWSKPMGGPCGIHAWVHTDPPLAAANHIYLTDEGSKRAAKVLFRELMAAFDSFERADAGPTLAAGARAK